MPHGVPPDRRAEFERLYDAHGREVWAAAYARWMDADSAMDITQEAFLRLWRQWEAGEAIQSPRAWLISVARNLAQDTAKSAFRRNGTQAPRSIDGVAGKAGGPADLLEREEAFAQLRGLVGELAAADRDILTLRYALDYDARQIAEALGIQVTAVHMRLSRARQRLADRLQERGVRTP